jgi:hypothetical protein
LMVRRTFTMTDFETGPGEALDRLYVAAKRAEHVERVSRSMRSIAAGLRRVDLDRSVPIRWTPPDHEVLAGNLDFGEADVTLADLLLMFAHALDGEPLTTQETDPE